MIDDCQVSRRRIRRLCAALPRGGSGGESITLCNSLPVCLLTRTATAELRAKANIQARVWGEKMLTKAKKKKKKRRRLFFSLAPNCLVAQYRHCCAPLSQQF